jgi:hypothetical protein
MGDVMKKCGYRVDIGSSTEYGCRNSRIHHPGTVPAEVCEGCLLRREPSFFLATEQLAIRPRGQYSPAPKSCGGCGTVKRRESVTQFVWPYWHGGACGDEIRLSVRSVETHFQGPVKCTIVGDRPPWFRGHVINQPRIPVTSNHGFRDMLAKMYTMSVHPEIDADFVWMMDDIYLLRPVTWDDLDTPRAYPWRDDRSNSWQRRKSNTMRMLRDRGRPNHDYATHLPHTVEKAKLQAVFKDFDLRQNTCLWEVCYGNTYRGRPYSVHPFFARITQSHTVEQLRAMTTEASVLNHLANCWTPQMRAFLESHMPEPTQSETVDSGYRPQYKRVARNGPRAVKRRPVHTHKAQH